MIADSTNTDPLFLSDAPDWKESYSFAQIWNTALTKAKDDAEQRGRTRLRPRYSLIYQRSAMTVAEFSVRRAELLDYFGAPIVVPIWHAREGMLSKTTDTITLDTALLLKRPFKIGSYAFIEQTGFTSIFRKITAITSSVLTFETGNAAFPDIAPPAFTAGAKVFPCILGVFNENGVEFTPHRADQTDQIVSVVEL